MTRTSGLGVLGSIENFSRDNHSLYLSRSFVDLVDFGVAHKFFNWIFCVEAVSSENLNRFQAFDNLDSIIQENQDD